MKLIDADKITEKQICHYLGRFASCCEDVVGLINDQSAVDAKPVVYGRWESKKVTLKPNQYTTINGTYPCCSVCGVAHTGWEQRSNFCPNCGADMVHRKK